MPSLFLHPKEKERERRDSLIACFVRFKVVLSSVLVGLILCRAVAVIAASDNPATSTDKVNNGVTMGSPLTRSSVGMGPDENFINPSIAVSEEFTDNVFQSQANKKSDFITHLSPGLAFKYRTPFWDWD